MAKEKNPPHTLTGLQQSWTEQSWSTQNCDHPPIQTLCTSHSETVPHSDMLPLSEDLLDSAFHSMNRRIDGLLEDRTRIGRDLHDSVLQSLYAIGLHLEVARGEDLHLCPNPQQEDDHLVLQLNHVIQEVRAMIASLESGLIQDFNLVEELESLQTIYQRSGRLRIDLDMPTAFLEILTTNERREILNIAREALSNCARHADATHVSITLRLEEAKARISIVDNGQGFRPTETRGRGHGLSNMEARAKKLGGMLQIRSHIGRGTAITIDFSLPIPITPVEV